MIDYTQTDPRWADAEHTQIDMTINGELVRINATPGLGHYDGLVASGVPIAPYVPSPPDPQPEGIVLYDHENRIRAIEGQPPLTIGDFLAKAAINHG